MPRNYSEEERLTEDEIARRKLGPRGVPGGEDSAKMTPQQEKNLLGKIAAHMAKANDADSSDRRVVRRTALARRPINLPCPRFEGIGAARASDRQRRLLYQPSTRQLARDACGKFEPRLFEPKSPLPGNGILRAETKRPKRL